MRALLLAAGFGKRLQPLTMHLPKCLVPIGGRPLMDYWLESLVANGIREILVNTHYLAPVVRAYIGQSRWSSYVTLVHEETLLGTGGTVLQNRDFFKGEPFLVAHADNLTDFDVIGFLASHASRPSGAVMTMMLFETDTPQTCGIVELDRLGLVTAFHEKVSLPPGHLANAAVYILEPSVVDLISTIRGKEIDISTQAIPLLMGRINTYLNTRYHRDIGTLDSWIRANEDYRGKELDADQLSRWPAIYGLVGSDLQSTISSLLKLED